jgi:uncharacterized protein (DUF1697 family)
MAKYIALLRAVNVGGSGKLPMTDLKAICAEAGYSRIETYIASGNVVFECNVAAAKVQADLEARLLAYAGKAVGAFVRTVADMRSVLEGNPFSHREPRHTYAFFLHGKPPRDALEHARGRAEEEIRLGRREIYVYYPSGMGKSKLRIPAAKDATARNMNTVARLVEMCSRI